MKKINEGDIFFRIVLVLMGLLVILFVVLIIKCNSADELWKQWENK